MRLWSWVCRTESSVGSAIPVVSMDIWQPSVRVAVKHHTPNNTCPIGGLHHNKTKNRKISKNSSFNPCRVL